MDDVLALALALNKLGEGGLDMQRRSRTSKRSDAPQRDPTDARALGQFTFRKQTHSDVCKERYVALLQVLQGLRANMCQAPRGSYSGFYKPVVLNDTLMHVNADATSVARRETRRLYIQDLALPNFNLDGHIFKRGGPHPDVVHVWAVPSETPEDHEVCKHIHIYIYIMDGGHFHECTENRSRSNLDLGLAGTQGRCDRRSGARRTAIRQP